MNAAVTSNLLTLPVNCASSGDNTIRAANAGKKIAIVDLFLQAEADVEITLKMGAVSLSGAINFSTATTRERLWQSSGDWPVFKAFSVNQGFILNLSGAVQINGWVNILEVDA